MEYKAIFGIDGGISPGFGVKYPDYIEEAKKFYADSDENAVRNAVDLARELSKDHLSNPKTGYTNVKILILKDEKGRPLYQEFLNKDPKINFEEGCVVIRCSTLEPLLSL